MAEKSEIDLYKRQIRHLEEKMKRSQLRCEELKKDFQKLSCWNEALEEDRKDISEYLLHCIPAKEAEEQELLRLLEQDQLDREEQDEAMKLQLSKKREEVQERAAQIHSNAEKLAQQKDEILQAKKQIKEQEESMEENLKLEAEKHKAAMESLKLELDSKIKMHQEAHDASNREMEAREQGERSQARQEAEEMQSANEQMSYIVVERESLKDRQNKLQKKIAKKGKFLAELTGNISQLSTEFKQLAMKCAAQEPKLTDGRMHLQRELAIGEALRGQQASLSEQLHQETFESQQLDVKLQKEKDSIKELKKTIQKAAEVLRATVKDFQNLEEALRNLQALLQFLEGSQPGGPVPTPDDSAEESSQGQKPNTSSSETRRLCSQETSAAQRD